MATFGFSGDFGDGFVSEFSVSTGSGVADDCGVVANGHVCGLAVQCQCGPRPARADFVIPRNDWCTVDEFSEISATVAPVWEISCRGRCWCIGRGENGGFGLDAGTVWHSLPICSSAGTNVDGGGIGSDDDNQRGAPHRADCRTHSGSRLCESYGAPGCFDGHVLLWWFSFHGSGDGVAVRACDVCCPEAPFREMEGCVRTFRLQSALDDSPTFQDGRLTFSSSVVATDGFYDCDRLARGVPDDGHQSTLSELVYISFSGQILQIQRSLFWRVLPPEGVHEITSTCSSVFSQFWHSSGDILGRHPDHELEFCGMCPGHTGRDRGVDPVGFCDLDQGTSETCARSGANLVWHVHLKSDDDVQLAQGQAGKNAAKNEKDNTVVQFRQTPHAQGLGKRSRSDAVDTGVCSASTAVQSRRAALRQRSDHAQQEVLGPSHAPASSGSSGEPATFRRTGVLRLQRSSDSAAASRPGVFERRKWVRWWDGYEGPSADRSRVEVSLAPFRARSTHQLEGARHSPEEPARFRFRTARFGAQRDAREQLRQHRGDVLCKSSGGSGSGTQLCRGGAVVLATRPWSDNQGCVLARSAKRGRGHSLAVVHRPLRVPASPSAVQSAQLALRPVQRRRFCVTRELPNAPVLVTLDRPRLSQEGRASTTVVGAQLVLAPAISAHRAGFVEAAGRKNHRSDSGRALVAQPALVARASVNDDGHGSARSGVCGDAASHQTDDDASDQYMDVGGVSSLREMLKLKGYYPKTIDRVVERYESAQSGDTLNRHRRFWDTSYVPWCREHAVNAYVYDNVQFANFLEHIQSKYEGLHDAAGKPRNHAMFKHARATLGDFMKMFHPEKPSPADSPIIQQMARSLRLSAPNLPHYSKTISLDPISDALIKAWKRGIRHETVDIRYWRDWTLILVQIRLKCRSADVVAINRIWTDDEHQSAMAGLNGVRLSASRGGLPDVCKLRYDFPKNV